MVGISKEQRQPTSYHRRVVTSFICQLDGASFKDFKVAILKRSTITRDHQGLWSACSGTIQNENEESTSVAWREVQKQTGLTAEHLSMLHAGKPHHVFAADLSQRWTVHPFAFVLKPNAKAIEIDWKHTEWRFVHPEEVETYWTVPDLDITLWRVLVGPDTAEGLKQLREDHTSGARSLATKAVRILLISVTGSDLDWSSNVKSYWRGFRLVAWHLAVNGRPSMGAAIGRAVLRTVATASPGISHCKKVSEAKEVLITACMDTLAERASGRGRVAQQFVDYLRPATFTRPSITFLTLSISCAKICLLEYVRQAPQDQRIHIIVLESRPCFEGVHMAVALDAQLRELTTACASPDARACAPKSSFPSEWPCSTSSSSPSPSSSPPSPSFNPSPSSETTAPSPRVRITLATDASAATLARDIDFVLLGSDRISPSGDISNKVGSLAAILTARAVSRQPDVEVLVASETEKIAHRGIALRSLVENNAPAEVAEAWPLPAEAKAQLLRSGFVSVVNVFFESVPCRYIDRYITETGVMERADIARQAELAAKEWEDVFLDL